MREFLFQEKLVSEFIKTLFLPWRYHALDIQEEEKKRKRSELSLISRMRYRQFVGLQDQHDQSARIRHAGAQISFRLVRVFFSL